ncbi:heme peroxidase [Tribonema minus]|uniref:Heme peroxidase n=1 Tax=Tribonema minus TaxID=303371 RepID=A0A835ZHI8_9STRA|nr:heme peroxidase [Tribonema minus]
MALSKTLAVVCAIGSPAAGFVSPALPTRSTLQPGLQSTACMSAASDRRDFLAASALALATLVPTASEASVYFEIDRYGDKELKLGTVSKIRQAWRNKMLADPSIAPAVLKLAISDALGYNAKTTTGGPDSSVVFEMDRAENKGLEAALKTSLAIRADMKRTSEVSLSDVIAFGGGEAIEATGGPRIVVQLGRYDEKKGANPAEPIPGYSFETPTGGGIKEAFKRAGLGAREAALLLGAVGMVKEITDEAIESKEDEEEDDLVDSSWEKNLPKSFGGQSEIYGEKIGKGNFDTRYISTILRRERKAPNELGPMDKALLQDQEVKSFLTKYDGNTKAFNADVAEAYSKMTLLGELYENRIQARD